MSGFPLRKNEPAKVHNPAQTGVQISYNMGTRATILVNSGKYSIIFKISALFGKIFCNLYVLQEFVVMVSVGKQPSGTESAKTFYLC